MDLFLSQMFSGWSLPGPHVLHEQEHAEPAASTSEAATRAAAGVLGRRLPPDWFFTFSLRDQGHYVDGTPAHSQGQDQGGQEALILTELWWAPESPLAVSLSHSLFSSPSQEAPVEFSKQSLPRSKWSSIWPAAICSQKQYPSAVCWAEVGSRGLCHALSEGWRADYHFKVAGRDKRLEGLFIWGVDWVCPLYQQELHCDCKRWVHLPQLLTWPVRDVCFVCPLHPLHLEYLPTPILGHFSHAGQSENFSAVFKPKLGQESVLLGVGAVGCGFHGRSQSATSEAGWTPAVGLPTPGQRLLRPQGSSALPA